MGRMIGAIAGGLVAGLGLTALTMTGERRSGKPSELVVLERGAVAKLGMETPPADALPDAGEQALVQGGHLVLSAMAGAAYAAATDDETDPIVAGVGFGLAFYGAMHWLAGPLLGVKPAEWRQDGGTIAMHAVNHVLFGLAAAAGAQVASRAAAAR